MKIVCVRKSVVSRGEKTNFDVSIQYSTYILKDGKFQEAVCIYILIHIRSVYIYVYI